MPLFLLVTACTTTTPEDSGDTAEPYVEQVAATSDGGSFYVMYSPTPAPIPFNEPFTMYWMVHDGLDHDTMFEDAELTLDALMIEHGHGMNTIPTITRDDVGGFDVEGMLFHMRGWWQLEATVTRGDTVETALLYVNCCEG